MTQADPKSIARDFHDAVNMSPAELERWLGTDASQEVGWTAGHSKHEAGGPESVGHEEGRRILAVKREKASELTEDDCAHMRKVVGYVHRHLTQRPDGDVTNTRWRHFLMNWGHDPLKA